MKPITVKNTSDRPIQVGSHYHFAEVNPGLEQVVTTDTSVTYKPLLESTEAKGRRLNIAAGKSVRFEPGDVCRVELVDIEGFVKSKSKSKSKGTDAEPATEEILGLRKGNV
ncbi:urease subunit beta [Streptomyces sp. NPDC003011]